MAEEKKDEAFLERWSRRKHEEQRAEQPPAKPAQPEPAALPPVDKLTSESDFSAFMHPKVQDALRRVALKKLFADPRFNVPDPFEAYSGDWTVGEPIPEEVLQALNQAKRLLFEEKAEKEKLAAQEPAAEPAKPDATEQAKPDEPGRKDA